MHKTLDKFFNQPEIRSVELEGQTLERFIVCFDWLVEMMQEDHWNLTKAEMASLISISESDFDDLIENKEGYRKFLPEIAYRMSYLLGIHRAFMLINPLPGKENAYAMFRRNRYEPCAGKTVKEFLLEHPTNQHIRAVRAWLDTCRMPSTYDFDPESPI